MCVACAALGREAPEFFLAWYNLSLARLQLGERPAALDACRKAVALEPAQSTRDASVYNTCGVLLYREGRYAEALPLLERAVTLEPSHARARRNLAATREMLAKP